MANIILPEVNILNEINDSATMLVEQNGEINRFSIADLDIGGGDVTINLEDSNISKPNPVNADTLGGRSPEEYIALANDYTNQQVKKAAPRNLLDNSDFRNPVNQRGQTTYTVSGYTIDRWIANKAQPVIVNTDGITLDGTNDSIVLRQKLNTLKDGTYTVAIKVGDNIQVRQYTKEGTVYTGIYTSGNYLGGYVKLLSNSGVDEVQFRANSSNIITAEWIALYEGEYTAETLPEYQPKGYDAELETCYQYYYQCTAGQAWGYYIPGQAFSSTEARITFNLPRRMKRTPTVTIQDFSKVDMATGNGSVTCTGLIDATTVNNNHAIVLRLTPSMNLTAGALLMARINTLITISCDL